MESREVYFPNSAWTILKKDANSSTVYLWQQPDFSAVFVLSQKVVADQVVEQLKVKDYFAYQFPDRETLVKLLENMAAGGVTSVATDPGEVGPIVTPINEVIMQLRSLS